MVEKFAKMNYFSYNKLDTSQNNEADAYFPYNRKKKL